ncbi:MAG: hypothetical protein M9894_00035 [Planctomycetes bacterium]|nr:hypothetical protein [Planctomycetota bacterium]
MKTALLVARGPCVSSAVCDVITPGGVRIVCARDCAQAARDLERGALRPRVVLIDLARVGEGAARELLERLRTDRRLRRTPVVVLADRPAAPEVVDLVVAEGALGALPNDLEDWRLVQVVDRLCATDRRASLAR